MYSATVSCSRKPSGPTRSEGRTDWTYEAEYLFLIPQHRVVVAAAVDQVLVAAFPRAVDVGVLGRLDIVGFKVFEQRGAIMVFAVVRNDLAVDRQQGRQIVRKRDVGRWTIIDGADRHCKQMTGGLGALVPDDAAILLAVCDRPDLAEARQPDAEKAVDERRDQELAAPVRLGEFRIAFRRHVRLAGRQFDRAAQCIAPHLGKLTPHLFGQSEKDRLLQRVGLKQRRRDQMAAPA